MQNLNYCNICTMVGDTMAAGGFGGGIKMESGEAL